MPNSLAQFFLDHFHAHASEPAYRQRRGYRWLAFSYEDVLGRAAAFAAHLLAQKVRQGDRILLWGENSAEWVAAFVACAVTGVIAVPMDDASSVDFAARVCHQVDAKLIAASRENLLRAEPAGLATPTLAFEDFPRPVSPTTLTPAALTANDTLQIVFTSGTTADPKGVVITHGNVLANLAPLEREMQKYLKYERFVHPLRFLNLLPLSHVFGQFLGMFLPPILGGTVIFQSELKPSEIIETIRRERVSVLVSVPRVLDSLKQKVERDLEDRDRNRDAVESFRQRYAAAKDQHFLLRWWTFRSIRRQFGWKFWAMISGGAALNSSSEEFWGRLGYAVIQGYGLTETTSLISVNHPFKLGKGSIGKVLPGRELRLADDGEILVRGGGVAAGYWGNQNAVADAQGWYRTGDLGALDAEGNLYFKGRKKEVIITPAGINIYPEDLEAALRRQPEVKDCVVIGIDRSGNAEPCAVVILHEGGNLENAVRRANQALADSQRMRLSVAWPHEDFPRTGTQKPRRTAIADAVRAQMQTGNAVSVEGPLAELISRITGRAAPAFNENARLDSDLGLSSLDRVELMGALEDRYQVDLSEARFSALETIGDLERILRSQNPAEPEAQAAASRTPAEKSIYHYPTWALRWPVSWLRVLAHYLLMRSAILLLGWPRIVGRENLRGVNGPLLVISNHLGDVDPGFILTALPARFRHRLAIAAGGEALELLRTPSRDRNAFRKIYDRIEWTLGVALLNLFPLPREAGFRRSFAYAGQAVDRGYSVLVFPEGRHTKDGALNPFRSGIGLLAQNLAIPVLPMRIDGLFEAKQAGRKFVAPRSITVKIGAPLRFAAGKDAAEIAAELQRAVENL